MLQNYFLALLDWWKISVPLKDKQPNHLFREGDVWWCSIGINVGVEIFGKGKYFARPVIIFKKFDENSFLGIPLTTQPKTGAAYISFMYAGKQQYAILSQIKTFDSRRLRDKIGSLPEDNFEKIKISFANFYAPENSHPASLPAEEHNAGIGG
jgi:mRNA interferase MazF